MPAIHEGEAVLRQRACAWPAGPAAGGAGCGPPSRTRPASAGTVAALQRPGGRRRWPRWHFSAVADGLLPRLRPAAAARRAATRAACPSTCRRRRRPPEPARHHRAGRLRGPRLPAADGAGPAGGGVRGLGGDRRLRFAHRAQPRRRLRPPGRRRRRTGDHRNGGFRVAARRAEHPGFQGTSLARCVK